MKFFNENGVEISAKQFPEGSVVVARVTKPMTNEEFKAFCNQHKWISDRFAEREISLIFSPDWVEFKDWK